MACGAAASVADAAPLTGDGNVAYDSIRNGNVDIFTLPVQGVGAEGRLTSAPGFDGQVAWSPDGQRLVFASERADLAAGELDIYTMAADGNDVQRVTSLPGDEREPTWSPDGQKIVFEHDADLYIVAAGGGGVPANLTATPDRRELEPSYGADGRLAFTADNGPNTSLHIFLAAVAMSGLTLQPETAVDAYGSSEHAPSFAGDGTKLTYVCDFATVCMSNPDGTGTASMANASEELVLAPSGRRAVSARSNSDILEMGPTVPPLTGTNFAKYAVSTVGGNARRPAVRPVVPLTLTAPATITEANANATHNVVVSRPVAAATAVAFTLVVEDPVAGLQSVALATIPAGATQVTVPMTLQGDTLIEDVTLPTRVALFSRTDGYGPGPAGQATIDVLDDDTFDISGAPGVRPNGLGPVAVGGQSLQLIDGEGALITTLVSGGAGDVISEIWPSPDGTMLAFECTDFVGAVTTGIWTVNLDGTGLQQVSSRRAQRVAWSPDGRYLLLVPQAGGEPYLATVGLNGERLLSGRATGYPVWLPNGRVAYIDDSATVTSSVLTDRLTFADDSVVTALAMADLIGSPDGTRLAWSSGFGSLSGRYGIYTRAADGTGPQPRITPGVSTRRAVTWTGDNQRIIAVDDANRFFSLAADGSEELPLNVSASYQGVAGFVPAPAVTLASQSGGTVAEPATGIALASFRVTRPAGMSTASALTVKFRTRGIGAASGNDFMAAAPGTVTIAAGQTSAAFSLSVLGDSLDEGDESLSVVLTAAGRMGVQTAPVALTITDDPTDTAVATRLTGDGALTFSSREETETTPSLVRRPADNRGAAVAVPDSSNVTEPVAWPPDGGTPVISAPGAGNDLDLFLQDPATGARTLLVGRGGDDLSPTFSPDGRKVVFARDGDLYAVDLTSGDIVRITYTAATESDPDWGSNGMLVYSSNAPPSTSVDLYKAALDASLKLVAPTRLTMTAGAERAADWSPDASQIVYSDATGIRRIASTGGSADIIATGGTAPAYSPSGNRIAYVKDEDIRVYDQADAMETNIGDGATSDSAPAWEPVPAATVSGPAAVNEGSAASFTVTLPAPSVGPTTINYRTRGQLAAPDADYPDTVGTATIPNGASSVAISLPTIQDTADEPQESVQVRLTGGSGVGRPGPGPVSSSRAAVVILDDDATGTGLTTSGTPLTVYANGGDLFSVTGAEVQRLTEDIGTDTLPEVSPNGAMVAFVRDGALWAMDSDGGGEHSLGLTGVVALAWSPDSHRVLAYTATGGFLADARGLEAPRRADGAASFVDWALSGRIGTVAGGAVSLSTMGPTGAVQLVTANDMTGVAGRPTFSADGTRYAFANSLGALMVRTIPANAVLQVQAGYRDPSMLPDGSAVLATRPGGVGFDRIGTGGEGTTPVSGVGADPDASAVAEQTTIGFTGVTVAEGATATLRLSRPTSVATDTIVQVSTRAGTASPTADFTPRDSTPVTIPAGQTGVNVTVATAQDAIDEPEETFSVDVAGPDTTPATAVVRVTDDDATSAALTGDGRIVTSRAVSGVRQLLRTAPDGGEPLQLTSDATDATEPSYSRDGTRIVYVSGSNLRVIAASIPTNPTTLAIAQPPASPSFAPDGQRVLYASAGDLWVAPLPLGPAPANITNTPDITEMDPSWGPDGRIVYAATNSAGGDLYIATLDDLGRRVATRTRLTTAPGQEIGPAFDSTATHVLYRCSLTVCSVAANGSGRRVYPSASLKRPAPAPAGDLFAVDAGTSVQVRGFDDPQVQTVVPAPETDAGPNWQPARPVSIGATPTSTAEGATVNVTASVDAAVAAPVTIRARLRSSGEVSASPVTDVTPATFTLTIPTGATTSTPVPLSVIDDTLYEVDETFTVELVASATDGYGPGPDRAVEVAIAASDTDSGDVGRSAADGAILYVDGDNKAYAVDPDGQNKRLVAGVADQITASLDGSVTAWRNGSTVTVAGREGASPHQFATPGVVGPTYPALSPDGRLLAFADIDTGTGERSLWVGPADGSEPPRKLVAGTGTIVEPEFSADGRSIVFTQAGDLKYLALESGAVPSDVPGGEAVPKGARARPGSGEWLFAHSQGGIRSLQADGSDDHAVTPFAGDRLPAWSPTGDKLLVARRGQLVVLDAETGDAARPVITAAPVFSAVWTGVAKPITLAGDATVDEPTSAPQTLTFTAAVNVAPTAPLTVRWGVVGLGATPGTDTGGPTAGVVTIPTGQTAATFTVPVQPDTLPEEAERFQVQVTAASDGYGPGPDSTADVTIWADDDARPILTGNGLILTDDIGKDLVGIAPDGRALQAVTAAVPTGYSRTELSVSADGRSVIFSQAFQTRAVEPGHTGVLHPAVIRAGTLDPTVTAPPMYSDGSYGDFTADGRLTAVQDGGLVVVEADGTNPRFIVGPGNGVEVARVSPDGRKVAYATSNGELLVNSISGGDEAAVAVGLPQVDGSYFAWKPDGSGFYVTREVDGERHLYSVDLDGGNLTRRGDEVVDAIAVAPNGKQVAAVLRRDVMTVLDASGRPAVHGSELSSPGTVTANLAWQPAIPVSVADAVGSEGSGQVTHTVSIPSDAPAGGVVVRYRIARGTAAPQDLTSTQDGSVTIPAGQRTVALAVPVSADTLAELDETYAVQLTAASFGYGPGPQDRATGTIVDDDVPTASVTPSVTVTEGNSGTTNAVFTVSLSQATPRPVSFGVAVSGGTAATSDFGTVPTSGTIAAGTSSTTVSIPVKGDETYENTETYSLLLTALTGATPASLTASGTITNDDAAPVVSVANVTVGEGAGTAALTVSTDRDSEVARSVSVTTADDTATAGADYTAVSRTLAIPAGVRSVSTTVPILQDNADEPDETFSVTVGTSTATVTITDDDALPTASVTSAVTVTEGDSGTTAAVFTVSLDHPGYEAVRFAAAAGGGTSEANDFGTIPAAGSIPAGASSTTVTVPIKGDTVFETSETYTLTLSSITGGSPSSLTAAGTITNDDAEPVATVADLTVAEGAGDASLTVSTDRDSEMVTAVPVMTADGTATAGADYTAVTRTLSVPAGSRSATIEVPILQDTADEPDETFTVSAGGTPATVTITDDDALPTASLTSAVSIEEGDTGSKDAVFTVSLDHIGHQAVGFTVGVGGGTASASDFGTVPLSGSIAAGASSATVAVPIKGDAVFENDETFTLTLASIVGAAPSSLTASGTITNDDATPGIAVTGATVGEGSGTATVTVSTDRDSEVAISAPFATADGSARAGEDYVETSKVVVVPAGARSLAVEVPVLDDTADEPDETFTVGVGGTPAPVTITDDDDPAPAPPPTTSTPAPVPTPTPTPTPTPDVTATSDPNQIVVTGTALKEQVVPDLRSCGSRRLITIKLYPRKGFPVTSVGATFVGIDIADAKGKVIKRLRYAKKAAKVDLRGLPKGKFSITVYVKSKDGKVHKGKRTFKTCVAGPAKKKKKRT